MGLHQLQTSCRPAEGAIQPERQRRRIIASALNKRPKGTKQDTLDYGSNWYKQTREQAKRVRANKQAYLKRKTNDEPKYLYSDNWAGDEYTGSKVNTLTVIAAISVLTPIIGLIFAFQTYGVLWG